MSPYAVLLLAQAGTPMVSRVGCIGGEVVGGQGDQGNLILGTPLANFFGCVGGQNDMA